jgi:inner membrane transporter RhtA
MVLVSILSVQFGSSVARTAFDVTGANGITLLRLAVSGLLLTLVVRPAVRRWSRAQLRACSA